METERTLGMLVQTLDLFANALTRLGRCDDLLQAVTPLRTEAEGLRGELYRTRALGNEQIAAMDAVRHRTAGCRWCGAPMPREDADDMDDLCSRCWEEGKAELASGSNAAREAKDLAR